MAINTKKMNAYADKTSENKNDVGRFTEKQSKNATASADKRPEVLLQRKLQETANKSPQAQQLRAIQEIADNYSPQRMQSNKKPEARRLSGTENKTGLPDQLKLGMEQLSGYSLNDVRVHYNSDKPAQLQAHAYAQGTDIHLASGQEKHLPHEAWHVVQQKQGRVQANLQLKTGININNDAGLEKEADVMGEAALQFKAPEDSELL